MTVTARGINASLRELDNDIQREIAQDLRVASLEAFADLRRATPVDQGFARNSWQIGYSVNFVDASKGEGEGRSSLPPSNTAQTIHITNGTDYIGRLNDGSSVQAPANFIESAVLPYFDNVVVREVDNS